MQPTYGAPASRNAHGKPGGRGGGGAPAICPLLRPTPLTMWQLLPSKFLISTCKWAPDQETTAIPCGIQFLPASGCFCRALRCTVHWCGAPAA